MSLGSYVGVFAPAVRMDYHVLNSRVTLIDGVQYCSVTGNRTRYA